jgi:AraC-like DNA-binding protein
MFWAPAKTKGERAACENQESIKMSGMVVRTQDWEKMAREAEFKPSKMATLCSMSERHLQRIFKKHLQRTPSQWLRELQCRLAKQLISQGYSSKAAAAELNFATDAHFCREFKKIFGTPPQTFAPAHGMSLKLSVLDQNPRAASATVAHGP